VKSMICWHPRFLRCMQMISLTYRGCAGVSCILCMTELVPSAEFTEYTNDLALLS
jgi:hypothetical protein